MTDHNGWPDAAKPGYPMNPERDGWHWVRPNVAPAYAPECWFWIASAEVFERDASDQDDPWFPTHYDYLGPCHTPAEVAALIDAAYQAGAEAMREAAAQNADCECGIRRDAVLARLESGVARKARNNPCSDVCLALNAAAIRALPLPKMETSND
jgi:hypothetical protein